jgi:ABC-type glycerol-3-phosphate transport system substrate-binding protein
LPEAQAERLAADIEAFQQEFPQFTVLQQHYDSQEDFMTPLATGELEFDLVLASPVLLGSLWATGQIAPMADFFPPSFLDGFDSVTLQGATQKEQVWGIPDTAGFHLLLFYNRDLIDTPPANTGALAELARAAQKGPDRTRWGVGLNSYDPLWLVPWLTPYGGWLTDEVGQPALDPAAVQAALELQLTWLGLFPDQGESVAAIAPLATYEEMRALFLAGDMAMMIDGEWSIFELSQTDAIDWGVARLPHVSLDGETQPPLPLVLARYWGINRTVNGDQALAAATFLEFITRPERQLAWTSQFGLLPTRRQALDAPLIGNNPALKVSVRQMRASRMVPLGVNANALLNQMREPLRQAIDGKLTPAEAAKLMQRALSGEE